MDTLASQTLRSSVKHKIRMISITTTLLSRLEWITKDSLVPRSRRVTPCLDHSYTCKSTQKSTLPEERGASFVLYGHLKRCAATLTAESRHVHDFTVPIWTKRERIVVPVWQEHVTAVKHWVYSGRSKLRGGEDANVLSTSSTATELR